MKTTILGGVLFLAPLAIIAFILGKAFQISTKIVAPLDHLLPIKNFAGIASVNILALLFIILLCYVAGLLAQRAFLGKRMQRIDGFLVDIIPGYAVFKALIGSASSNEELAARLKPVIARFDDYEQIAFEIEHGESQSVLFLPGSPSAWSGSTVIADNSRITPLNIPAHQATKLLRTFGRGSLEAKRAALSHAAQGDQASS
ncbi:MAG: hypothetical protein WBV62_13820 [Roseobacter sp.]